MPETRPTMRPRIAKPVFEYSKARPGGLENGIPAASSCENCSSLAASWRSPQGLSSGKPSEWVSRCRMVMTGASLVGYRSPASSGTYFAAGSSSDSFPSSRRLRMAMAVKLFVMEAMRNTVSGSAGDRVATSRNPIPLANTSSPSTTIPKAAPGTFACANRSANSRSISGKAVASVRARSGSAKRGGGQSLAARTLPAWTNSKTASAVRARVKAPPGKWAKPTRCRLSSGQTVVVVREEVLEGDLPAGQLRAQPVHVGGRHGGERAGRGHVCLQVFELRHPAHDRRDGQAPGVAQKGGGSRAVRAEQLLLRRHLHEDDAQVLLLRSGERLLLEAKGARRVHRHLHTVEVVPLDGLRHHRALGVARHADEARDLLLPQLVEGLERAVHGLDLREVVFLAQAVDVHEIHVVGLEPLEAGLHFPQGLLARARAAGDLRGEKHLLAARRHHAADPRLALAVAVVDRGVEVVDPQPDGPLQDRRGLLGGVHEESAPAAHGEDRDRGPGTAEGAVGDAAPCRGVGRPGGRGERQSGRAHREAASLQELATGNLFAFRHLSLLARRPTPASR